MHTGYLDDDFIWILNDLNIDIENFDSTQELLMGTTPTISAAFCEKLNQ